jgi:signal transduction histidine kinase
MLNGAQLLQMTADKQVARTAARIRSSGNRMAELIEDLLDFTRIRVGQGIQLQLRPADLLELCRETMAELQAANPSRRIEYTSTGDCRGTWDPDRIGQVVSNLVGNAVKHSPPGSPVFVALEGREEGLVRMRVHNDGPAISDEVRAGLFDPFQRAAKMREQGLGLGLFISDQIARLHGGRIDVRSGDREGTDFTLELPRRPGQPSA